MSTHRPIDIIVPVYRNAELVRDCLDTLLQYMDEIAERSPRLVLINDSPDDAETDAVLNLARSADTSVLLLRNEQNLGFVRTVNRGLSLSLRDGHDALLVNSDTLTFSGTLREIVAVAGADRQIGFVSPRSNNASICSLPHFHGGTVASAREAHLRWVQLKETLPRFHFTPTAVGFFMFIAHRVLADHGLLDDKFGVGYEEENDLVMRAGKVGVRAVIANHAFAFHAGAASFSLLGMDLQAQRRDNLASLSRSHPEFLTLVRRYESSAHYRAERLLSGLLADARGRVKWVIDLTGLGLHHNGTNEHSIAVVRSLGRRWSDRFRIGVMASEAAFSFHGLDKIPGIELVDPAAPGVHAIGLRLSQPFDLHHINLLERIAVINVFAMLDTIAEDCGPLASDGDFLSLWSHVAAHADGLLFNSIYSEATFCARHPAASARPRMASLLPTRVREYVSPMAAQGTTGLTTPENIEHTHVLVLGNHFPHKGSDVASRQLAAINPTIQFVVIGGDEFDAGNLVGFRSGQLPPDRMLRLYREASVIVLPSHVEGFGFGFMHALAAGRPIVARRIGATEEILATFRCVEGVFLFEDNCDLPVCFARALKATCSRVDDSTATGWDDWTDRVANFSRSLLSAPDLFVRVRDRIAAGDLLRAAAKGADTSRPMPQPEPVAIAAEASLARGKSADLQSLLSLDGTEFIDAAYQTLLARTPDESGLAFYICELQNGVGRLEVLRALATSPEGRSKGIELAGLREALSPTVQTPTQMRPTLLKRLMRFRRLTRRS